jgi:hypothetical protein
MKLMHEGDHSSITESGGLDSCRSRGEYGVNAVEVLLEDDLPYYAEIACGAAHLYIFDETQERWLYREKVDGKWREAVDLDNLIWLEEGLAENND